MSSYLFDLYDIQIFEECRPSKENPGKYLNLVSVNGEGKVLTQKQFKKVLKCVTEMVPPEELENLSKTLCEIKGNEYHMKDYDFEYLS